MNFGLNSDVNRTKREVSEPNPIKVSDKSKEPKKQPPKISDDMFQKVAPVEVNKGINPVILFVPAIGFGVVISHCFF